MKVENIKEILAKGEGLNIEFKSCQNEISGSVYETVCSFLNHSGGCILIGVNDEKEIIGVNTKCQDLIIKNFVHVINNPNLFSPRAYVSPEIFNINGKTIILIIVERSQYVHRYKNRYYDRNNDSDSDVTDQPALVAKLFSRKDLQSYENRIVPMLEMEDLDNKTFDYCRKLVMTRNDTHPWIKLSNEQLLRSCGMLAKDSVTNTTGIKMAALLLFGKDESIASFLPAYRIEAIYRNMNFNRFIQNNVEDTVRYDDRITIRSNLINAYDSLMDFTYKHLPERFYLPDGTTQRGDLRSNIFREVVANLCVHRNYASNDAGFFEIFSDRVITRNVTSFTTSIKTGIISIDELVNYTKNPLLFKVFRELGWGEELGSGSRNIKKFAPLYYDKSVIEITNDETFIFSITYNSSSDSIITDSVNADSDSVNTVRDSVNTVSAGVNSRNASVNADSSDNISVNAGNKDVEQKVNNATEMTNPGSAILEETVSELLKEMIGQSLSKPIKKRMVCEIISIYKIGVVSRIDIINKLKYSTSQIKGDLQVLRDNNMIIYLPKDKAYSLSKQILDRLEKL